MFFCCHLPKVISTSQQGPSSRVSTTWENPPRPLDPEQPLPSSSFRLCHHPASLLRCVANIHTEWPHSQDTPRSQLGPQDDSPTSLPEGWHQAHFSSETNRDGFPQRWWFWRHDLTLQRMTLNEVSCKQSRALVCRWMHYYKCIIKSLVYIQNWCFPLPSSPIPPKQSIWFTSWSCLYFSLMPLSEMLGVLQTLLLKCTNYVASQNQYIFLSTPPIHLVSIR